MGLNCDVSPLPQAVLTILYMIASHANFYVFYIQKKKEKEKSNFLDVFFLANGVILAEQDASSFIKSVFSRFKIYMIFYIIKSLTSLLLIFNILNQTSYIEYETKLLFVSKFF